MVAFCVECKQEMRVMRNGVKIIVHSNLGPRKIYVGDRYQCPTCGKQTVTDFGDSPIDNYGGNPEFARALEMARRGEHYDMKEED